MWTRSDGLNLRVQGAFRRKGGRFGAAQTLSEPGDDAFEPDVAVDERGNALAVWTRNEGFKFPRVQFSFRPRVGSFAEPAGLSAPAVGAFQPHVATDRWNNALAVWTVDPDPFDPSNPTWVEAAFAPAGGPFGPPERLSDPSANAFQPRVAFERDGDAVIAWTGEDERRHATGAGVLPACGSRLPAADQPLPGRRRRVRPAGVGGPRLGRGLVAHRRSPTWRPRRR